MATASFPILTYHSIDESGSVVSVSPPLFARQMAYLATHGYRTLTFAEAVACLRSTKALPEKHVVITFDDGYRNVYTEAFLVLQQYGFNATVFIIPDYCGKHNDWPGHMSPAGYLPLMDWPQIRTMHQYGIEIAAHTCTHPDLTQLTAKKAEEEIALSKSKIEHHLDTPVNTFAYPYGAFNESICQLTRHYFQGACTTRLGRAYPSNNPYLLDRIDMYYFRRPDLYMYLPDFYLTWHLKGRQVLRDIKSRWR